MDAHSIKVLIIDDHQVVREGLHGAFQRANYKVVGEAASKEEGFAQIAHKVPDVIVVDLNLPGGSGLEIVTWARSISKTIGIVVLTMSDDDAHLLASLQAGASAYVLKTAPLADVVSAVAHAFANPMSFSGQGISAALIRKKIGVALTSREMQVLKALPSGRISSRIAQDLFITEATVKTHLSSIYRKLGVENRTQAVSVALRQGFLP